MALLSGRLVFFVGVIAHCLLASVLGADEFQAHFTKIEKKTDKLNEDAGLDGDISKKQKQLQYKEEMDELAKREDLHDVGGQDAAMAANGMGDFDLGETLEGNRDRSRSRSRLRFLNSQNQRVIAPQAAPKQVSQSGMSTRMAKMVVGLHNSYRRTVPGPAANMEEMKWDDDLATMALGYAKQCIWGHGNPDNITPYQHVGQNLAYSRGGAPASPMYLISHWFNEKKNYDIYTDACVPDTVCGHYTQVVWALSNKIGCAMHFCPVLRDPQPGGAEFSDAQLLVCNYGPGGNVNGHTPYQIGQQCSLCASGLGNCRNGLCSECSLIEPGCECHLECQNGGVMNSNQCKCDCPAGWTGTLCQNVCNNTHPWCGDGWPKQWCFVENDANPVEQLCPALCGVCECGGPDCENGGTKNPDSCMCDCIEPWSGATCSDCNIQCVHGSMDHETCHCSCDDGWMGQSCSARCENTNKVLCHRGWYPNWCDDDHPYVLQYCQAMCGLCNPVMSAVGAKDCDLTCFNQGLLNRETCACECPSGWHGEDCTAICRDEFQYCEWSDAIMCESNEDFATNFCPVSCGKCVPNPAQLG